MGLGLRKSGRIRLEIKKEEWDQKNGRIKKELKNNCLIKDRWKESGRIKE